MSFWKSKVVPKFKKLFFFEKAKKKGALEAVKAFDGSKESYEKEIEEKTPDLQPKILEIYKSSTAFVHKKLLKDPSEAAIKDNPEAVQSVLAELGKAGFPGAETLSSAASKFGVTYLPGPVLFVFQKASIFLAEETLPEEEEKREAPIEETPSAAAETTTAEAPAEEKKEEASEEKKKEEEETKTSSVKEAVIEEAIVVAEATVTPPPPPPPAEEKKEEKKEEATAAPPPAEDKKKEEEIPPPSSAT